MRFKRMGRANFKKGGCTSMVRPIFFITRRLSCSYTSR
jgi:hypothetical protein